jgi:nucleoside-diphosphate-sugar epimerase
VPPDPAPPPSSVALFGTGQIGVFAARALTRRGLVVHAADAAPDLPFYARFGAGADAPGPATLDVTRAGDVDAWVRSRRESAAVVFAAGYTGERAAADPAAARLVAERGVENVLAAARERGITRAVVVSSLAVYGEAVERERFVEDGPTEPRTTYGQIQLALERTARTFVGDLDVAILRIAGVFGPQRFGYGSHSSRFVERLLYSAGTGNPVRIEGCWEDEDDLIYVKDVGEAIGAAALTPGTGSFTANVGLGRVSTLREVADAVLGVFPTADIAITPADDLQRPVRRAPLDTSTLGARLGVRAAFPLPAAMRDYASEAGLVHAG